MRCLSVWKWPFSDNLLTRYRGQKWITFPNVNGGVQNSIEIKAASCLWHSFDYWMEICDVSLPVKLVSLSQKCRQNCVDGCSVTWSGGLAFEPVLIDQMERDSILIDSGNEMTTHLRVTQYHTRHEKTIVQESFKKSSVQKVCLFSHSYVQYRIKRVARPVKIVNVDSTFPVAQLHSIGTSEHTDDFELKMN